MHGAGGGAGGAAEEEQYAGWPSYGEAVQAWAPAVPASQQHDAAAAYAEDDDAEEEPEEEEDDSADSDFGTSSSKKKKKPQQQRGGSRSGRQAGGGKRGRSTPSKGRSRAAAAPRGRRRRRASEDDEESADEWSDDDNGAGSGYGSRARQQGRASAAAAARPRRQAAAQAEANIRHTFQELDAPVEAAAVPDDQAAAYYYQQQHQQYADQQQLFYSQQQHYDYSQQQYDYSQQYAAQPDTAAVPVTDWQQQQQLQEAHAWQQWQQGVPAGGWQAAAAPSAAPGSRSARHTSAQHGGGGGGRPSRAAARKAVSYFDGDAAAAAGDDDDDDDGGGGGGWASGAGSQGGPAGGGADDDFAYAQQMQEEWNGLRTRHSRPAAAGSGSGGGAQQAAPGRAKRAAAWTGSGRAGGSSKSRRTSARSAKVSYREDGDNSEDSEAGAAAAAAAAARREPVPALDDTGDGWEADGPDEVERVLGHRDAPAEEGEGGAPAAAAAASGGGGGGGGSSSAWSQVEFKIKWRRQSYAHTSWQPLHALTHLPGFKRVTNYIKRTEARRAARAAMNADEAELEDVNEQMEQQLYEQYTQVERVVAERPGQSRCLLVKWEGLPYEQATWETSADVMAAGGGPAARESFLTRQQRLQEPAKGVDAARAHALQAAAGASPELTEQPAFLAGGTLRQYQLQGLNWMMYAWLKNHNAILADEMGLGKTVQCVSLLGLLAQQMQQRGPFLVVVPLSVVPNWAREFRKWVPQLNAVVYVGDGRSREVLRAYEFPGLSPSSRSRPYGFEALITTYELCLKDAALLSKVPWSYLMVDEAHRLKNSESALYQELASWSFKNKLLVTGTPLQNNIRELWALLDFLQPGAFGSADAFEAAYKVEGTDKVASLQSLHSALKPFLLRRVIKDVETSLPPKTERILRVEMSPLQRRYYKWILGRNFAELNKGARAGGQVSLLNVITELKKACNHPFLFQNAEDEYRLSDEDASAVDRLTRTSGKMVLLDKLLARLKASGHRVLIFSQMVRVLDIISDYMRLRGYAHQRLDGSTPAAARHAAMEAFNRPDSPDFAFLLSTRAGGLGINLATADTVIIFDSDWNPQNDLQAMSRAHRIGQTETVNIYRFVTSGSVEEEILERAKRKMVLDHLVIQRMDTSGRTVAGSAADAAASGTKMFGKEELAAILRFGAEDLFKAAEGGAAARSQALEEEEDIDAILQRAEIVSQEDAAARDAAAAGGGRGADLLSSFNVATFKNEEDDATFWSRLIAESDRPKEEREEAPLGPRAARSKQPTPEVTPAPPPAAAAGKPPKPKAKASKRPGGGGGGAAKAGSDKPGPPVEGAALRVDEWHLTQQSDRSGQQQAAAGSSSPPAARSLSKRDAASFVRAVRRFGLASRLADISAEAGGAVAREGPPAARALLAALSDGCRRALAAAAEHDKQQGELHDARHVTLDYFGHAVKAAELSEHLAAMEVLSERIEALTASGQDPAAAFTLEAAALPAAAKWCKALAWGPRDDAALLLGVYWHGLGHWEPLIKDSRLGLQAKLACVLSSNNSSSTGGGSAAASSSGPPSAGDGDGGGSVASGAADKGPVAPKASHLETRVLSILRKLLAASGKQGQPARTKQRAAGLASPGQARKLAARAAVLAAAGITGERATPTPTPPPPALPLPQPAEAAGPAAAGQQQAHAVGGVENAKQHSPTATPPPPPAAASPAAVDGPAAASAAPAAAAAASAAPAAAAAAVPPPPPAAAPHVTEQQLATMLAPVSAELQGLLRLNESAASGGHDQSQAQVLELTRTFLLAIGQAVQAAAAAQPKLQDALWRHVVAAVKTPMSQGQFTAVCEKLVRKAAAAAAAAGGGDATAAMQQQTGATPAARAGSQQQQQRLPSPVASPPARAPNEVQAVVQKQQQQQQQQVGGSAAVPSSQQARQGRHEEARDKDGVRHRRSSTSRSRSRSPVHHGRQHYQEPRQHRRSRSRSSSRRRRRRSYSRSRSRGRRSHSRGRYARSRSRSRSRSRRSYSRSRDRRRRSHSRGRRSYSRSRSRGRRRSYSRSRSRGRRYSRSASR